MLCMVSIGMAACFGSGGARPTEPLDIEATVEAAVAGALPIETPTPTVDVNATITAGMIATQAAVATPTPTPEPTPNLDATVEARLAATLAAMSTSAPTPAPKSALVPAPTPEPSLTPVPTYTRVPAPTPTATPVPTRTPRPTPTATPGPAVISLSEMVRRARPAVVRIETATGNGSGVIFETQGQTGYVITNHHVVEGFGLVTVVVNDSSSYQGTVRGIDHVRDLAVVSICCGRFQALPFGNASDLEAGDEVVAIGYALGLSGEATITRGIVSATRFDAAHQSEVIQTDAAINPGNSGGPMLSPAGEILGINTFRYDESDSGRPAEGLGFAISEETVRARIPALKAGRAAPAPTPTRRPRPTPAAPFGEVYGPVDGELRHNPSENIIKTEFAGVHLSDFIVSAYFVNPYSSFTNSWDYGFFIRASGSGSASRFLELVVTSDRNWQLVRRQGRGVQGERIAGGPLPDLDNRANGENRLWLLATGDRGIFFINGVYVASLDLSDLKGSGDVAVITGAFAGNEVRGEVTRYKDFLVLPLQKRYGPASGRLTADQGFVAEHDSGVWAADLVTEADFSRPPGSDWDVGFVIRNPQQERLEVIGIRGDGWWFHDTRDVGDTDYTDVDSGLIRAEGGKLNDSNNLLLVAISDFGMLLLNDVMIARLDLSHNLEAGDISAMGDYYRGNNASPKFSNFNVWTP